MESCTRTGSNHFKVLNFSLKNSIVCLKIGRLNYYHECQMLRKSTLYARGNDLIKFNLIIDQASRQNSLIELIEKWTHLTEYLTLYEAGWALKAPPEEKLCFWYIFVIIQKNLTFPKYLWQCLPYSIGVSKLPKNGFL